MTYDYVIKMPPKREYIIRGRIIKRLKGKCVEYHGNDKKIVKNNKNHEKSPKS